MPEAKSLKNPTHNGIFLHVFERGINESEGYLFALPGNKGEITIGRLSTNDLWIHDDSCHLTRFAHAIVSWDTDGVYIEDRGSTNGTIINEENIRGKGPQRIELGTRIILSPSVCIYLRLNPASSIPLKSDLRPTVREIKLK